MCIHYLHHFHPTTAFPVTSHLTQVPPDPLPLGRTC
jgi:hypothetical protein